MKKICVVSGTRADYGLLYWTMKGIQEASGLELQIIATGMHLSEKFGDTWKQFEKDGFQISKKVSLGNLEDAKSSIIQQVSIGVKEIYAAYDELKPDAIVILGDRYEMLAAAQAAVFFNVPIVHIHGGEITEGAFDDIIRHSITKMSSYHFSSTEEYRKRVIQMGEFPDRVVNAGAVGLENIKRLNLLSKTDLENDLKFKFQEKNFLITYHPVTASKEDDIESLLSVLAEYKDVGQFITLPNSDPGHDGIIQSIKEYASSRKNVFVATSLGSLRYLSLMKHSDLVIGNSSSGIIEAPFVGTPTINIGTRQKGRLSDKSVLHTAVGNVKEKIEQGLKLQKKQSFLYGDGDSSQKIIKFLKNTNLTVKTGFYDI